jgi:hypothetical protein
MRGSSDFPRQGGGEKRDSEILPGFFNGYTQIFAQAAGVQGCVGILFSPLSAWPIGQLADDASQTQEKVVSKKGVVHV